MPYRFLEIAGTPSVKVAQAENGSGEFWAGFKGNLGFTHLTDAELQFIAKRDSFYMATTSESGWPYVQHRGGPPGFLRAIDATTSSPPENLRAYRGHESRRGCPSSYETGNAWLRRKGGARASPACRSF